MCWKLTDLRESSLYIAQVRREYELDVGHNYNLTKKDDPKMPQYSPEKGKAIREALELFQMI